MNEHQKKRFVRRIRCPITGYYIVVESKCEREKCSFWDGVKCVHKKSVKTKRKGKGYRAKRPKIGRRDRGRKDSRIREKWSEAQNGIDGILFDTPGTSCRGSS